MKILERINLEFIPNYKDYSNHKDYNCWGFEAIMNLHKECEDYINYKQHIMPHGFETWLYYAPSDYRMVLIDFSNVNKGIINLLDGTYYGDNNRKVIKFLSLDEFLSEYGMKIIYSVGHWKVKWKNYGMGWDN